MDNGLKNADDLLRGIFSHMGNMGYTLTGESKYWDIAIRLGDSIIALQSPEGFWSGVDSITGIPGNNMTAEMVIWLDEVHQAVGGEEAAGVEASHAATAALPSS